MEVIVVRKDTYSSLVYQEHSEQSREVDFKDILFLLERAGSHQIDKQKIHSYFIVDRIELYCHD